METDAARWENVIMSSGATQGFIINLFAWGTICIAIGKAWDLLGNTMNNLNSLGLTTQDSMNTFHLLTICFYAMGILFLIASGYNLIVESKRDRGRNV
ncbi:MAG: hypothetical protein WCX79_00935 [Candidatus Paceibacterota bacterium]